MLMYVTDFCALFHLDSSFASRHIVDPEIKAFLHTWSPFERFSLVHAVHTVVYIQFVRVVIMYLLQ